MYDRICFYPIGFIKVMSESFGKGIKRIFLKGLAALLPTALTIYIVMFLFSFVKDNISQPITTFLGMQMAKHWDGAEDYFATYKIDPKLFEKDEGGALKYPTELKEEMDKKLPWWPGFIVVLIGIFIVGVFLASFLGRRIWRIGEKLVNKVPIIKVVYSSAKQVTDFVFGGDRKGYSYSKVVAVQYPSEGLWSVGFLTGDGLQPVKEKERKRLVTVFIPCSPTPMSGFTVVLPEQRILPLEMSFEEAMRFIISCGVVTPEKLLTEEGKRAEELMRASGEIPILPASESEHKESDEKA